MATVRWKDKAKQTPATGLFIPCTSADGLTDGHLLLDEVKDDYINPALKNTLRVSETGGDATTFAELVVLLDALETAGQTAGVRVVIDGGDKSIDATVAIDYSFPISFEGSGIASTRLIADTGLNAGTGLPMFTLKSRADFTRLAFIGNATYKAKTTGAFISLVDDVASTVFQATDIYMYQGYKGVCCENNDDIQMALFVMEEMGFCGIGFNSINAGGSVDIAIGSMIDCPTGLTFVQGDGVDIHVEAVRFLNEAGQTAISYTPATFVDYDNFKVQNCEWNRVGTSISGFDFTLARDANIEIVNNTGIPNNAPYAYVNVDASVGTTTITPADTFYKATFTADSSSEQKFTVTDNNITSLTDIPFDAISNISATVKANAINTLVGLAIVRIRSAVTTIVAQTKTKCRDADDNYGINLVAPILDIQKDDQYEIHLTSDGDGDILILEYVNWLTTERR